MAEKMTKKELKQPDALQRAGLEAGSWIEGKEKLIVGAIVAALGVGLVLTVVSEVGKRNQRKAERALGAALEPVTRSVVEGDDAPAANDDQERPPFPSQTAKDEAVVASLTAYRQAHPGTKSAGTAALPLAQSLHRLGRHDEAVKAFDEFLGKVGKDDPLRAAALEGKGYALEAKGELDQALRAFEDLAAMKTAGFLDGMGQLHKARMLILQDKKEEAAKVLAEIPGTWPNTAAARQAAERLNLLASQGVAVPAPKPADADQGS